MINDLKDRLKGSNDSAVCVVDEPRMGAGPCTLCDCPSFEGQTADSTICINQNSEGGTCNHWMNEHS
jgi:hypothetical protein